MLPSGNPRGAKPHVAKHEPQLGKQRQLLEPDCSQFVLRVALVGLHPAAVRILTATAEAPGDRTEHAAADRAAAFVRQLWRIVALPAMGAPTVLRATADRTGSYGAFA